MNGTASHNFETCVTSSYQSLALHMFIPNWFASYALYKSALSVDNGCALCCKAREAEFNHVIRHDVLNSLNGSLFHCEAYVQIIYELSSSLDTYLINHAYM